jgi:transcriptional regulator with XRE-family HTH domain
MTEQQYGRRAVEVGPTGRTVAENLARLRKVRGLSTRQLAAALKERGRPISPSGITRMEKGDRVATADDLTALAAVLGVSPAALLLPLVDSPEAHVEVTGAGAVPADVAWAWASNERPLELPQGDTRTTLLEYQLHSLPPDRRPFVDAKREMFERLASWGGVDLDVVKRTNPELWRDEGGTDGPSVD